jgi:serine/threonine-protein kinase
MAPALSVGQVIGTYGIVRKVGSGGMGEIYEVSHSRLAGRYAMKVLRAEPAAASEALTRFQREAKVTSALQHPNIVQGDRLQHDRGGQPYLVMEFLDGPELAQVMKGSKPLPLPRIVSYVKQIASGLLAAHEHDVVHRDLKPQNIFVLKVTGSDQDLVKIVDFGISKISAATATITSASTVIGTAQYMSPEQALGRIEQIDARTDQFSLALIVYEMLTGETAFRGESVSSVVYQIVHEEPRHLVDPNGPIPPAVASVLKRALAKGKERRFPTVKAFADAFEGAATASAEVSATTIASQRSTLDAGVRLAAPSRRRLRLGVGLAGLAIAGAASGVLLLRREPPRADEIHASASASGPIPAARRAPEAVPPAATRPIDPAPVPVVAPTMHEPMKRDPAKSTRRLKPGRNNPSLRPRRQVSGV